MEGKRRAALALAAFGGIAGVAAVLWFAPGGEERTRPADSAGTLRPPPPDRRPTPGETIDLQTPFAYGIYLNGEAAEPKFQGRIATVRVFPLGDPDETPGQECPGGTMAPMAADGALAAVSHDPDVGIRLPQLPAGVTPVMAPDVWDCDGTPVATKWTFTARPGMSDANKGGTGLTIARTRHRDVIVYAASAGRWRETVVAGVPAVVVDPIVQQDDVIVGGCLAASLNEVTDVLTQVQASSANADFCLSILAAVLAP